MDSNSKLTTPKIVISIVNWNGYTHTTRCLQSIRDANMSSCEIVVVDNASRDDSVMHLRAEFPEVRVIRANTNLGFAGGHRLALDYALSLPTCELFWMLNNDTRVLPHTLDAFTEAYKQYGDAIYGGVPLNEDYTIEALVGIELTVEPSVARDLYFAEGLPFASIFEDSTARLVTAIHGSNFVVPLEAIRQHGFMDTAFFLYAEETDYCFRLRAQGVKCILVPKACVFHGESESTRGNSSLGRIVSYYSSRNYLVFVRRHYGARQYMRELLIVTINELRELARSFTRHDKIQRTDHLFALRGIFDGVVGRMGKTVAPENYL